MLFRYAKDKSRHPKGKSRDPKNKSASNNSPVFSVSKDAQKLISVDTKLFEKRHVQPAYDRIRKKL